MWWHVYFCCAFEADLDVRSAALYILACVTATKQTRWISNAQSPSVQSRHLQKGTSYPQTLTRSHQHGSYTCQRRH